ncbi:7-deoxyloganetin glucosyltransferase [Camellia lanceoleosa]|uniref:7-deoxyloganetin glucosyltransferase n=1 Tax=Camellia lanceoleosa TaxID=1840588 RepID=A0ACC0FIS4_9ERIC|nr:7-deoxyloganetin glucosyltransferase [Camellia lanceoleosa]
MCAMAVSDNKPHAVCIPFPAQSHIKGILKLAKLLHHKGFYITFVNTEFNQKRLIKARGHDFLYGLPNFQFKTIPDGLPPSNPDATQDVPSLCGSVRKNFLTPFRNLLANLNGSSISNNPPVTCIVSDGILPFTITAAQELRIPVAVFWTFAACGFMGFYQYRALLDKGLTPLKDASYLTNGYLDTEIDWIPGMKDIPQRACEASAFCVHTFDALEENLLDVLSSMFPHVYTIGHIQLLLNQKLRKEDPLESLGYSLWKEEPECLYWLDSKEPSSVVYVNFGSVTVMSQKQLVEFAWGLANNNHCFLWIIRPDLVIGDSAILPPEFIAETKQRGLIEGWCPQEEVLNHPSVGGFLTHSGWNSTIESLSVGVPMMCWPFFADQQTNCRYTCNEWEVGMEIDNNVKRDEVEKLVRELMGGKKGKKMKNKAMEWKKLAEKAASPGYLSTYLSKSPVCQVRSFLSSQF